MAGRAAYLPLPVSSCGPRAVPSCLPPLTAWQLLESSRFPRCPSRNAFTSLKNNIKKMFSHFPALARPSFCTTAVHHIHPPLFRAPWLPPQGRRLRGALPVPAGLHAGRAVVGFAGHPVPHCRLPRPAAGEGPQGFRQAAARVTSFYRVGGDGVLAIAPLLSAFLVPNSTPEAGCRCRPT